MDYFSNKPHNPLGLSDDDIGTAHGWRLLQQNEIRFRAPTPDIQCWSGKGWMGDQAWCGDSVLQTYRTLKPAGHFVPGNP